MLEPSTVLAFSWPKPYRDSTFAKISEMVQGAQEQHAPTQRFVEKFARWYTPFAGLVCRQCHD